MNIHRSLFKSTSIPLPVLFGATVLLLTLIHPPVGLFWGAWVAWIPFIVACSPLITKKKLVSLAYVSGLIYWLINLYWIFPITILGTIALSVYMAFLWPLCATVIQYARQRKLPLFLCAGICLVGAEYLQGFPFGGFFWRFLAYSQFQQITLIQCCDFCGAAGLSFLIAVVNGLGAELYIAFRNKRLFCLATIVNTSIVSILLLAACIYGSWRLSQTETHIHLGPRAGIIQSNVPQSVKTSFQAEEQIFDDMVLLNRECASYNPDLIVWPETMVQAIMNPETREHLNTAEMSEQFHRALAQHAQQTSAYILIGAYGGRLQLDDNGEIILSRYNSAFLYRPDGSQAPQHYDKMHLVLLGEYIPFRDSCPWLFSLLSRLTPYDHDYSLHSGQHPTVFQMSLGHRDPNAPFGSHAASPPTALYRFGVMICYEDTVPNIARQFIFDEQGHKRVDWLVNISNDGWFVRFSPETQKVTPSAELMQHVAVCVFRAVENRVAIVRSVNTGISCIIDSCGRIQREFLGASPSFPVRPEDRAGMAGWFINRMPIDMRVSFFSKYGQWLDIICACSFVALFFWVLVMDLIKHLRHRP